MMLERLRRLRAEIDVTIALLERPLSAAPPDSGGRDPALLRPPRLDCEQAEAR